MKQPFCKSQGWDIIGELFWNLGHAAIRENKKLLELVLNNIKKGDEVWIEDVRDADTK